MSLCMYALQKRNAERQRVLVLAILLVTNVTIIVFVVADIVIVCESVHRKLRLIQYSNTPNNSNAVIM